MDANFLLYFKQFSLAEARSSNVSTVQLWKTFLFQAIQSLSMSFIECKAQKEASLLAPVCLASKAQEPVI